MSKSDGLSSRVIEALAAFGLDPDPAALARAHRQRVKSARATARAIASELGPGAACAIVGPSGSGKSTILRELGGVLRRRGAGVVKVVARRVARGARGARVIDLMPGPLPEALGHLARAGLADATLLGRRAGELSEGESFRLALALAIVRAGRRWVLIDEYTSGLDRLTAGSVSVALARWLPRTKARVVVATVHGDAAGLLRPGMVVHQPLWGPPTVHRAKGVAA